MKNLLLFAIFITSCVAGLVNAQTSVTYNSTGGTQTWTVPACVTSITVTVAGADGGGNLGGNGAVVTATLSVTPGQVIQMNVGGSGGSATAGYNGGGLGYASTDGNTSYNSSGGGGASTVSIGGTPVIIAAGGGGAGGGSGIVAGGAGGCATGLTGANTFGAGGTGGSQTAGGLGGAPWAGTPPGGQNGSLGQGGNGGLWQTASGGGGGGGYYGGGGGGNDGCCTGANGGGGGSGGSSLVPAGAGCNAGTNNGSGYITIVSGTGITATNTGPYCAGNTIQLNGSPATTYSWTGPNGFTSSLQNPTIPNSTAAMAGVYSLTATGTGCSAAATTNVVVNPPITPNAGIDDTVCFGSPINLVGTLSVATDTRIWSTLTNGITPTPTVQILPAANSLTPTINVNQPGLYSFILLESNPLCGVARDTVNIFVKQMTISQTPTNPSCATYADGTILLTGLQATEYSWNNGATWSTNPLGTGFAAGTYNVCVRDANLCTACTTSVLTDPALVVVSTSNDTLICQNGTAQLMASATGGTSYLYHWDHVSSTLNTQLVSPLINTTYTVYAENENGCISSTESINVTIRNPITGVISPNDTICPGYPTTITASAIGGIGIPYLFTWSSGETGSGSNHTIPANPPVTTMYTVTVTDQCESTPLVLTTNVIVAPLPVPQISVDLDNECEPAIFVLTNETDSSMVDYVYWEFSDGQIYQNQDVVTTEEMWSGLYNVQMVVTSPQGCIDSTTFYNYLTVHPKPIADFRHNPNPVLMFNTEVQLTNYSVNGETYQWYIESGNPSYSELKHLKTSFPDGVTGQYNVTLITTSEFGCIDTATQIVIVLPEVLIYAPNAFTPDGDEHNQSWGIYIEGIDVYDFELLIFNRWGQLIWESHDASAKWDGTYGGKVVQQGTYTWVIRAKDVINDGKYEFNGFVTILK